MALPVIGYAMGAVPPDGAGTQLFRPSPRFEQVAAVGAFFGIKTLYTVLTAWLIVHLARRKFGALGWGLAAFFGGEAFCFVNVMWFGDLSLGLEFLHGAGMVAFLGLAIYAGVDHWESQFLAEGRCGLLAVCGTCAREGRARSCRARRMGLVVMPGCAVAALLAVCVELRPMAYDTMILGKVHTYAHAVEIQWYEWRFLPWAAVGSFGVGFLWMYLRERVPGKVSAVFFAAGCGAMGFSWLRLLMVMAFQENQVWFAVWEELTELLIIGGIAWGVWLFGRRGEGVKVMRRTARLAEEAA